MEVVIKKSAIRLKDEIYEKCVQHFETEYEVKEHERDKIKLEVLSNDIFVHLFDGIEKASDEFLTREFHNIMKEFFQARLENMFKLCVDKLKTECHEMVKCAKEKVQQDDDSDDDDEATQPSFAERLHAHLNSGQKQPRKRIGSRKSVAGVEAGTSRKKRSLSETSSSGNSQSSDVEHDLDFIDGSSNKRPALRCLCYVTCGSSQEPIKLNDLKQKAERSTAKPYVIQKYKDYKKFFKSETQASHVEIYFKQCSNRRPFESPLRNYTSYINVKDRFPECKFERNLYPCIRCFHAGVTASKGKKKSVANTRKQIYFGWLYSLKCAIEQFHGYGYRKFGLKSFSAKNIKWDKPVEVSCSEARGLSICSACLERSRPNSAVKVSDISKEFPEFKHLNMKSYGANIHAFNTLDILARNRKSKRKQEFTIGEHLTGIYLKENKDKKELYLDTTQKKVFDDLEGAKNMMQLGSGSSGSSSSK